MFHDKSDLIGLVNYFGGFDLGSMVAGVGEDVDESLLAVANDLINVDIVHIVFGVHSAKYMINIVIINLLNFLY